MSAELFKAMTKCDMLHVPYRGSALAFPDIISDKVQLIFDNLPSALEQAKGGTVRALGVTSPKRWPSRARRARDRRDRAGIRIGRLLRHLGAEGHAAGNHRDPEQGGRRSPEGPKLVARLAEVGGIPKPMTPAEFGKLVADETEKWRKVVEFAGVSVD
jgi:tripartite-type tricarboxylate transporter receptor subunit TctC